MNNQDESLQSESKKPKKRRSQAQKVGRLKYIIRLQKMILKRLDDVERRQRWMLAGYSDFINLSEDYIFLITCKDEVDKAILVELRMTPGKGLLPSELSEKLSRFDISRQMITYRIRHMNKRLNNEIGRPIAEKRGHHWALTPVLDKVVEDEDGNLSESVES